MLTLLGDVPPIVIGLFVASGGLGLVAAIRAYRDQDRSSFPAALMLIALLYSAVVIVILALWWQEQL